MTFLGFFAKRPELIAESTAMFLRILNYNHVLANHSFSLFQHPHQLSRTFLKYHGQLDPSTKVHQAAQPHHPFHCWSSQWTTTSTFEAKLKFKFEAKFRFPNPMRERFQPLQFRTRGQIGRYLFTTNPATGYQSFGIGGSIGPFFPWHTFAGEVIQH